MNRILSIDQGTTSSRAVLYDFYGSPLGSIQKEFPQYFPECGWVEHDASEIWQSVLDVVREVLAATHTDVQEIAAIGITNQRETVVLWDRKTGLPLTRSIVWQDRRTSGVMQMLRQSGKEEEVRRKTGLLLDPYFSASKIAWMLDHIPGARQRAVDGELAVGTIDAWLVWNLTGGRLHVTDVTNASRTMLMNLEEAEWDASLLSLFQIPRQLLPEIVPSCGILGRTDAGLFGSEIPIGAVIGDQQSSLFGQRCFQPGNAKCTYGTGCFLLAHAGTQPKQSAHHLISTAAWQRGGGPVEYAIEGSVFVGGAAVQWLRDGLQMIQSAEEINPLAESVPDSGGVVVVPAFTGLGAPYWDAWARGAVFGITRGTTSAHIARATLEGIAHQVTDLIRAMEADTGTKLHTLRVDGGASASNLLMQTQADLLGIPVERPADTEITSRGAAFLAGLASGVWSDPQDLPQDTAGIPRVFLPSIRSEERRKRLDRWMKAVRRSAEWEENE